MAEVVLSGIKRLSELESPAQLADPSLSQQKVPVQPQQASASSQELLSPSSVLSHFLAPTPHSSTTPLPHSSSTPFPRSTTSAPHSSTTPLPHSSSTPSPHSSMSLPHSYTTPLAHSSSTPLAHSSAALPHSSTTPLAHSSTQHTVHVPRSVAQFHAATQSEDPLITQSPTALPLERVFSASHLKTLLQSPVPASSQRLDVLPVSQAAGTMLPLPGQTILHNPQPSSSTTHLDLSQQGISHMHRVSVSSGSGSLGYGAFSHSQQQVMVGSSQNPVMTGTTSFSPVMTGASLTPVMTSASHFSLVQASGHSTVMPGSSQSPVTPGLGHSSTVHSTGHCPLPSGSSQSARSSPMDPVVHSTTAQFLALQQSQQRPPGRPRVWGEKRDFSCLECGKMFKSQQALGYHRNAKHGTREDLLCPLCGKMLSHKQHKNYHMTHVHGFDESALASL